jgi:hypothetical protein
MTGWRLPHHRIIDNLEDIINGGFDMAIEEPRTGKRECILRIAARRGAAEDRIAMRYLRSVKENPVTR